MTVGVVAKIQQNLNTYIYYDFSLIRHHGPQTLTKYQVEFRHVQLILLGYVVAILCSLLILLCEKIHYLKVRRVD